MKDTNSPSYQQGISFQKKVFFKADDGQDHGGPNFMAVGQVRESFDLQYASFNGTEKICEIH
jgi:hypothetical protein